MKKPYGMLSFRHDDFMHQITVVAEVAGMRPAFKIPAWLGE